MIINRWIVLIAAGSAFWGCAAQDNIVNGADLLGFVLIFLGVAGAYAAASSDHREESE